MNTLLYLSYGRGPHEKEVAFSALSAYRSEKPGDSYRILIYTDHPESFEDLPAGIHYVSPEQWIAWAGPQNFNHRRKILALQHALACGEGPVVLLDGDTWLRRPVDRLFERVSPGRTVMHIREGRVSEVDTPLYCSLKEVLMRSRLMDRHARSFGITPHSFMWNAGVIGLDPADAGLLDTVLDLTDQLCNVSELHVLEQFAFSWVLAKETHLTEAADLVFHYWPPYLHVPFRASLVELFVAAGAMPLDQRVEFLFSHRPQPTWARRTKVIAKRILQMAGFIQGRCRSNEW